MKETLLVLPFNMHVLSKLFFVLGIHMAKHHIFCLDLVHIICDMECVFGCMVI